MCTCPRAGLKKALLSYFTAKSSFWGQVSGSLPSGLFYLRKCSPFLPLRGLYLDLSC